jgi:glycosyltransferase involved in cell wall biosynthesis
MKLTLVFPAFPPKLDGIGDHTARLAAALAERCNVTVLTTQPDAVDVPGVDVSILPAFDTREGRQALVRAVKADAPDWLFVQFNQFSYGRWGFNPGFPLAIRHLRKTVPGMRIAVMFHEDYVPITSWKFAVMTTWQRWQFWMLGRQADQVFFSIHPWVTKYRSWFPDATVSTLPVGSNMPYVGIPPAEAKQSFGLSSDRFTIGIFGQVNASRMVSTIAEAAEAVCARDPSAVVLYAGPQGDAVRTALPDLPLLDLGALPAEDVSRALSAMDVHLAPFMDGISSRRGSALASLQHGVATVSTLGVHTDAPFRSADGTAIHLAHEEDTDAFVRHVLALWENASHRSALGAAGQDFYRGHFDWSIIGNHLLTTLGAALPASATS